MFESAITSPFKRAGSFIWTDLRSLLPKMLRLSLESLEIELVFLNTRFIWWRHCIFAITSLFPLWKKAGFFLISIFLSFLPKGALCQVLLRYAKWFWKRILEIRQCNFATFFTWKRGVSLFFPLPRDALCSVWLKLVKRY